jgi:hypothetical protein
MVWDPREQDWQEGLAACQAYADEFGSIAAVRGVDVQRGFHLGRWVAYCRGERRKGKLSIERVAALDELGMVWDPREQQWLEGLAICQAYADEFGSIDSVKATEIYRGSALGAWLRTRRGERKKGKLAAERIAALDALGMVWESSRSMKANGSP